MMATTRSNFGEVVKGMQDVADALNLKSPTRGGGTLGKVMIDQIANDIFDNTVNQQKDMNGQRLKALKPSTLARKRRLGQPDTILVATAEMVQIPFIEGKIMIGEKVATIEYHGTEDADNKADWTQSAGREFYGIPPQTPARLGNLASIQIDNVIKANGG